MARHLTTRARRVRSLAVLALAPLAVLAVLALALIGSHQDARRDLELRFAERAASTSRLVDVLLASTAGVSSRTLAERGINRAQLEREVRRNRFAYGLVAATDGRVLFATRTTPIAAATRAGALARRIGDAPYLLEPVPGAALVEMAVPFDSPGGRRVRVGAVPLAEWSTFFDSTLQRALAAGDRRRALIVDASGRVIGDSGRGRLPHDAFRASARIGGTRLHVVFVTSRDRLYASIGGRRGWAAWLALGLAAVAMGGGLWLLARLRRSHEALRRSEERYALALRAANDALWDWDLQSGHVHYSERWDELTGAAPATGIERWLELVHPDDRAQLEAAVRAHLDGRSEFLDHEHRLRDARGDWMWALARGLAVFDERGSAVRMAGSLSDVTARRRALDHLEHQATHDPLTGLANRAHFFSVLERSLERARLGKAPPCAVVFLDLDGFKLVNDGHGHVFGDAVLATVGARLLHCVRPGDVVGRLGGDELAVLLPSCADLDEARAVAERLSAALREPYEVLGESIQVSASAGVAVAGPDESAERLLREADAAMYRAKLAV